MKNRHVIINNNCYHLVTIPLSNCLQPGYVNMDIHHKVVKNLHSYFLMVKFQSYNQIIENGSKK